MDECITLSDDDENDVVIVEDIVNIEPILIDLTDTADSSTTGPSEEEQQDYSPPSQQTQYQSQQAPYQYSTQRSSAPSPPPTPTQPNPSSQTQNPSTTQPSQTSSRQPPSTPQPPAPNLSAYQSNNFWQPLSQFQVPLHQATPVQQQSVTQPPPQSPAPPKSPNQPASNGVQHPVSQQTPQPVSEPSVPPQPQPQPQPPQPQPQPQPQLPPISDHDQMWNLKTMGNEKYRSNQYDLAIRFYKKSYEIAKRIDERSMLATLHFNLAMTYYRLGSLSQAADECAMAVRYDDAYVKAHRLRAEIFEKQSKFDEAVICYEHLCELDNSNQQLVNLLNKAKQEAAKHLKHKDFLHFINILGLRPQFTQEELKKSYRRLALSHHPDRHSDADIVTRRIEERRFKEASEAHSFLSTRRFNYG